MNKIQEISHQDSSSLYQSDSGSEFGVRQITRTGTKVMLKVKINGNKLKMLYDPGAHHSVIRKRIWESIGKPELVPYPNLIAYTNIEVVTLRMVQVHVLAFGRGRKLSLIVVEKDDVPLFGLD